MIDARRPLALTAIASAVAFAITGCAGPAPRSSPSPRATASISGTITVDAASSLTGTLDLVATRFEQRYPHAHVVLNYGGSGSLAAAIVAGAPVDVFAAASPATMDIVAKAGLVDGSAHAFARNQLEIAVPAGNPGKISGLDDFADAAKKIALCDPAQPCGAAAAAVFESANITPRPDTLEPDVKAALTAVSLGEVDAAMVYRTDVLAAGTKVEGISFPRSADFIVSYPIAGIRGTTHARVAAAFTRFVLGPTAQKVLANAGFLTK